tara:strand:+ start:86 stop:958 length:873 start_codon:yes stop_codon:yes gene_type:complete
MKKPPLLYFRSNNQNSISKLNTQKTSVDVFVPQQSPHPYNSQKANTSRWDWCLIINDLISNYINNYGNWESHLSSIYCHLIKEGDTVLDAGANIGGHTLDFAYLVGETGKVIAFEPQSYIFNILTTNILINGLTSRVKQHNLGLSNNNTPLEVIDERDKYDNGLVNYGGREIGSKGEGNGEEVIVTTIDALKLKTLNFLKMDIQGLELEALEGGNVTIQKHKPIIFIENYAHQKHKKDIKVIKVLKNLNYIGYRSTFNNQDDCIFIYKNDKSKLVSLFEKLNITEQFKLI